MAEEDGIKLDVRNDLRDLDLIRVQYPISVTQAARAGAGGELSPAARLGAARHVVTTALGCLGRLPHAVTTVAGYRIDYIIQRAQLALDLELMVLDDGGFWPSIRDDGYQPAPNFPVSRRGGVRLRRDSWLDLRLASTAADGLRMPPSFFPQPCDNARGPAAPGGRTPEQPSLAPGARTPEQPSAALSRPAAGPVISRLPPVMTTRR